MVYLSLSVLVPAADEDVDRYNIAYYKRKFPEADEEMVADLVLQRRVSF
jgi:hypothetical protein